MNMKKLNVAYAGMIACALIFSLVFTSCNKEEKKVETVTESTTMDTVMQTMPDTSASVLAYFNFGIPFAACFEMPITTAKVFGQWASAVGPATKHKKKPRCKAGSTSYCNFENAV